MPPEVVTLRGLVARMRGADALDLPQHRLVSQDCLAQLEPVVKIAAVDDVVNGGQSEALVVKMAMLHSVTLAWGNGSLPAEWRLSSSVPCARLPLHPGTWLYSVRRCHGGSPHGSGSAWRASRQPSRSIRVSGSRRLDAGRQHLA